MGSHHINNADTTVAGSQSHSVNMAFDIKRDWVTTRGREGMADHILFVLEALSISEGAVLPNEL